MGNKEKYVLGVDYGTESGRVVLINASTGAEAAAHVTAYRHGVIDRRLPTGGEELPPDWALQHPGDYLEVLRQSVPEVLRASGVSPEAVIGIGVDFTSCTMLPVNKTGVPLCFLPEYENDPHSWTKLWKHHAAEPQAERLNRLAGESGEAFLNRYGGSISSEWMLPKVMQIAEQSPDVFHAADYFVEAADWIVWQLCGEMKRNSCCAGYKGTWHKSDGYPDEAFLQKLDPKLSRLYETKLGGEVYPAGVRAGGLTKKMANELGGLQSGTAVSTAIIDAHAAVLGCGVTQPGELVLAMGTSLCHMLLSSEEHHIDGVNGVVEDGIVPGWFGYEAGQPAVGDMFAWFVNEAVPGEAAARAATEGISIHAWLEREAARLEPGQSGLIALDWWNGSRSPILNADLSGLLIGLTLSTKPEEIYRALLEAAAFGTRRVVDCFRAKGIQIHTVFACGGLPQKNKLLMQIFADVLGMEIKLAESTQPVALGAAICGSAAAGSIQGGYNSLSEAARSLGRVKQESYRPNPQVQASYERLYDHYCALHEAFGTKGGSLNEVMLDIKRLKQQSFF
ncbi:MAG: ribulokinase [Paenibacillus sp.]|jgi:L-ribulokinase|nr:ribulokinase [Paenibacillus sp.]